MREADEAWPAVSVVMPIRAGDHHAPVATTPGHTTTARALVSQVLRQDYPGPVELIVVLEEHDAEPETTPRAEPSLAQALVSSDPRVRVVRRAPGTVRLSDELAAEATYDLIVGIEGIAMIGPSYLRQAVEVVRGTTTLGTRSFAEAMARAVSSRLGMRKPSKTGPKAYGAASGSQGSAEPLYFSIYRRRDTKRASIERVGGTAWLLPETGVPHRPGPTPRLLVRQFYLGGQWRHVLRRSGWISFDPSDLGLAGQVLAGGAGLLTGLVGLLVGSAPLTAGLLVATLPVCTALVGAALLWRGLSWRARLWLPLVLLMIHLSWGSGYLTSPPYLATRASARRTLAAGPPVALRRQADELRVAYTKPHDGSARDHSPAMQPDREETADVSRG